MFDGRPLLSPLGITNSIPEKDDKVYGFVFVMHRTAACTWTLLYAPLFAIQHITAWH